MAELLIKAMDASHPDITKDAQGCYKTGMVVTIFPDNHIYGLGEGLPTFFKIKIPMVSPQHPILQKLIHPNEIDDGFEADGITIKKTTIRRRRSWLKFIDIPNAAKTKIRQTGELIIKATNDYTGPFDYTWNQIKQYLWDEIDNDTIRDAL